jgi:hypothetical protein
MSKMRHWKERWDPTAPLQFNRSFLVLGGQVHRGDPLTQEIRDHIGPHRVKLWWDANCLTLDDSPRTPEPKKTPDPIAPGVKSLGGPWWEFEGRKYRGRVALERALRASRQELTSGQPTSNHGS